MNPGAGVLPAQRGPVPGVGVAPSSGFYPTAASDHAIGITQRPAAAVPPVASALTNMPQAHGSMPATMPQLQIQPLPPPPEFPAAQAQCPQSVTMADVCSHDGHLVNSQHYRPASVPVAVAVPFPISHPNHSQLSTPFTPHPISVPSCVAVAPPCQHPHNLQQRSKTHYACPQMHRHVHVHPASPAQISIPLEGPFGSWTATTKADGGISVLLDEALEDFVAGVEGEMKGGPVLIPPDPSLGGYHRPGRYVEEAGVGKGMIIEWMKIH
ncbi:hypothetical protein BDW68DRAFT_177420 [Aspergillus falconensis]